MTRKNNSNPSAPAARLQSIPSVERLLSSTPAVAAAGRFGRSELKRALGLCLDDLRAGDDPIPPIEAIVAAAGERLESEQLLSLRRVVNATGVIIHTNLGRSPVRREIVDAAATLMAGYSNLEFDLGSGARGSRNSHLEQLCARLFGCEAAILTNNNAAATMLAVAATAPQREVVVSRGELVEIGGAFRVPEVIEQGGARLREVGTTNRTRAADYARAVGDATGALLRVHRSNFEIVGFTERPSIEELVAVAREKKIPFLYDEGSGRVVDLSPYGFQRSETVRELFDAGVDLVTCSTDKLIGATQGGLILGRRDLVERCARHPLMRAVRAGKESFAIIAATLAAFVAERHERDITIYRMLAAPLSELRERAAALASRIGGELREVRSVLGGGTTPAENIASFGVAVPGDANASYERLLRAAVPVAGRIESDELLLDVRTLLEGDEELVVRATR